MSTTPAERDDRVASGFACPFCNLPQQRILRMGELCLASADAYPVSPGHTLMAADRFEHLKGDWRSRFQMAR